MEPCKGPINRPCKNTTTIQVSVYKTSIDILSYMKLVELKISPCVSYPTMLENSKPIIDVSFKKSMNEHLGKHFRPVLPAEYSV